MAAWKQGTYKSPGAEPPGAGAAPECLPGVFLEPVCAFRPLSQPTSGSSSKSTVHWAVRKLHAWREVCKQVQIPDAEEEYKTDLPASQ